MTQEQYNSAKQIDTERKGVISLSLYLKNLVREAGDASGFFSDIKDDFIRRVEEREAEILKQLDGAFVQL